jgi:hypothetical protein
MRALLWFACFLPFTSVVVPIFRVPVANRWQCHCNPMQCGRSSTVGLVGVGRLGPLAVLDDAGRPVPLGGPKEQRLLAVLAVHVNEPVSEGDRNPSRDANARP